MNTRVLFNWKPRSLDHTLDQRLRSRFMKEGWYTLPSLMRLRNPALNKCIFEEALVWHQDEPAEVPLQFIVWSNVRPTEIRFPDGSSLETKDGDVILIDNQEVEHRAPANQTDRWFVRTGLVITV